MPQPNNMLPSMSSSPMATGMAPSMMYGMEGMPMPFQSDPRFALAGQFILAPKVKQMMGQQGFAPMGLGHDQNVYDAMKKQAYTQMQAQVVQMAAKHDRDNMFKTFRGMSAMAGVGFGAEQRRAANSMADMAAFASPMLVNMNPDMLDQLGGSRGSAAVMAKRMMDASRYRLDPVTGRMGNSPDSVTKMTSQLYDDLYVRGDPRDMGTVTAGQAGALFGELTNRGMLHSDSRPVHQRAYGAVREMGRTAPAELAAAAKRQGVAVPGDLTKITSADLDKLTLDDSVASRLRSFDADKIKRSLKSYAGAVTAMRDIFGDMGHPNAPMQELMGGLEAMTMGSMSQMDPARAGMIARQTHNLAKQTGVTMDSAMVLQQHAGARAQQLGLEPIFAVHAAQGALAFGGAYRSQGHAAHTAFGAFNADQMTQLDANLRLQAAGSNMANQLGVAMRVRETAGFKAGTDADRYTTAVMSGVNEFVDAKGKVRSLNMNQTEFMGMMSEAGVDEGTVRDMLDQRDTNREQIDRYGITNIVRKEQAAGEMRPQVALRMGETLNQRLRSTGKLKDEEIQKAIDKASPAAAKRVMEMSTEKFANTGARETEIGKILEEELRGTEAGNMLAAMKPEEKKRFLAVTATQFYGNMDRFVKTSGYRGMGSFQNVHRSMNADVMREADRQQMQARFTGEMQEALSPLGRGTALSRAVDAMQEVREGDTDGMQKVLVKAFGGVDQRDVNMALQKPLQDLARKKTQIEQLQARVVRTTDSEEKAKLLGELDGLMREVKAQTGEVAKTAERFGIYQDGGLTREDTGRALKSTSAVAKTVMDLAGVRGGFGKEVSDEERAASVHDYNSGNRTREMAALVIMERRRHDPAYQATEDEAKKMSEASGGKVTVDQAKAIITQQKQAGISRITDADLAVEMAKGGIDTNIAGGKDVASALAVFHRSRLPLRGTPQRVKQLMAEHKDLTAEQAQEYADTEARGKRMGVTTAEIELFEKGDAAKGIEKTPDRHSAINAAIANREAHRYVVSDEQRAAYAKAAGLEGKLDLGTDAGKKVVDEMILKGRQTEEKKRFQGFRQSDDGARFREDVDMRSQDVENVMSKLITSPAMMKRFGMWSIKMHDDLKAGQQELRDMAMLHTGGDMSRLMMGDYDIDTSTKEGAAKAMAVRNKVNAVVTQQTRNIHAAHGAGSGQVPIYKALDEGGDKGVLDPVRELVKRHAMISMGLSPDMTVDELKAKHGGRVDEYEQARRREAEKLDFKGLHADHQKGIAEARERLGRVGSHFQLGTQTEALIEGGDPKLNPVRRLVLKRALIAKGLDPSIVKDDEEDIPKAIAEIERVHGKEKKQAVMEAFAAEGHKLDAGPKSGLHQTHQDALMAARERIGNAKEALGLLGVRQMPGETIADTMARIKKTADDPTADKDLKAGHKYAVDNFERTIKAVAATRRVRTDEEGRVQGHMERMKRVEDFAATHGTSAKEMAQTLAGRATGSAIPLEAADKAVVDKARAEHLAAKGRGDEKAAAEALKPLDAVAAKHGGVSPEELFAGKFGPAAKLSDPEKAHVAGVNAALAKTAEERGKLAAERGGLVAELDKATTPEARAAISKKIAAVDEKLDKNAEEADKTRQGLAGLAKREGLTVGELMSGERSSKKLTAFSKEEEIAVGRARSQVEEADKELKESEEEVLGAEFALGRESLSADQRKEWEGKQATALKRVADAKQKKRDAIEGVAGIAKERGTTGERLVFTEEGRLTKEQIGSIALDMQELGKSTPEIHAFLKERGVSLDDMRDMDSMVKKAAEDRQKEAAARENMPSLSLLSEFQEAFGFEKIDPAHAEKFRSASTKVGGVEQRRLMQSVIGTQMSLRSQAGDAMGTLEDRVKKFGADTPEHKEAKALLDKMRDPKSKNAGIDTMVAGYRDAMAEADPAKRKAALEKFTTTFGMNDAGMRRFEQAYELQAKFGTLDYGDGRRHDERQIDAVIDRTQHGGVDLRKPAEAGGLPSATHVTGVLELKGNVGYMDASTGGGTAHGGPAG